ncbi:hypothetical protein AAFF_G00310860 [Aldrovandia affinis]|uniref:Uncharacterized protein n=1 Tax=Aldrovandia affinis TaxID=143900 RepID=A0AAD7W0R4_9TELE|nr:hypothetical protein AAFF_G00310860 [Aldrovandia affinis]
MATLTLSPAASSTPCERETRPPSSEDPVWERRAQAHEAEARRSTRLRTRRWKLQADEHTVLSHCAGALQAQSTRGMSQESLLAETSSLGHIAPS